LRSNGDRGTSSNAAFAAAYGKAQQHIPRDPSTKAPPQLKTWPKEAARPLQRYALGEVVVVPAAFVERLLPAKFIDSVYSPVRNHAVIVGVQWGGNERKNVRDIWVYVVRPFVDVPSKFGMMPWVDVAEDEIISRVD
jgi:hypothetical protein